MSPAPQFTGHEPEEVLLAAGRCAAKLKQDPSRRCRQRAGHDTTHVGVGRCALHLGSTENHRKHAEGELLQRTIASHLADIGDGSDDHLAALARQCRHSDRMVQVLERLVGELGSHHDGTGPAIYGPDHLEDLRTHPLVGMLGEWSDRHAKQRKLAIDAGLDERQLRVSEEQGRQLGEMLRGLLAGQRALLVRSAVAAEVLALWDADVPKLVRHQIETIATKEINP